MSRATKITLYGAATLLALSALTIGLLLSVDWDRAKPWISQQLGAALGRAVDIRGPLSLTWHVMDAGNAGWRAWVPWPRLHAQDVVIANPDRATTPVMLRARDVVFSINPLALPARRILIPLMSVNAPELVLERNEKRQNNWTFSSHPSSAWSVEVGRLAIRNGNIHWLDAIRHADIHGKLGADDGRSLDKPDLAWQLSGTLNGEPVHGEAGSGSLFLLKKSDSPFPLALNVDVGKTKVAAQGQLSGPWGDKEFDLKLKLEGPSLAQLQALFGLVLPHTAPYVLEGRLHARPGPFGGRWRYENVAGRIGVSDVAGMLQYEGRVPRSRLEGEVQSTRLNTRDLSTLIGAGSVESATGRGDKSARPGNRLFPATSFDTGEWKGIEVDVQFSGRSIVRDRQLPISNLMTRIRLNEGVLTLAPLEFGIAGGNVASRIRIDGNRKPAEGRLELSARHLKLVRLFPELLSAQENMGEVNGELVLAGTGNSIAALLGTSNGEMRAVINEGAISRMLLEKMGMNFGAMLSAQIFGDESVRVDCALADFKVQDGVMRPRAFVVDTEETLLQVQGEIDLKKESLALTIYPESRGLRLISLRSPLHVSGSFRNPAFQVDNGSLAWKAGSAIALGALAPAAAALIPLISVGPSTKSECGRLLGKGDGTRAPPASKPGAGLAKTE